MGRCPPCNLQYKQKIKYNHELTDTHLEANNQYYCQQSRRKKNLPDERPRLQSNEHKNIKKLFNCEACKKDEIFLMIFFI